MKRKNQFNDIYRSKEYSDIDEPPEFPFIIDIELTNNCNLNCRMCSRNIMTRETGFMSRDVFNKIIDGCSKYGTAIRLIRWGEPFLHPHILDFIKLAKDNDIPIHITTNGLILSEVQMKAIIELELDSIIFSMQGATKSRYEYMRNNELYDSLEATILRLVELREDREKPYIHITTTIDEVDMKEDIDAFAEYWETFVDEVTVGRTSYARIDNCIPVNGKYIHCKEPWQKLSVDWDGKVTACCGDYDNLLTVGDINEDSLYYIWNFSDVLQSIRILLAYDKNRHLTLCSKCFPAHGDFK